MKQLLLMKITKSQLKQIIKEELEAVSEVPRYEEGSTEYHIDDALGMLEKENELQDSYPKEYQSGAILMIINRLQEALDTLENDPDYNRIDDMD